MRRQQRLSHGQDDHGLPQLLASLVSPEADPARAAEINDAIAHVCRNLPPPDRRLLELRLAGCTTVQAARELDQDPDVLRVRLSRLRRLLRDNGVLLDWF